MLYLFICLFFYYVQIFNETISGTVSVMLNDGMVVNNELVTTWHMWLCLHWVTVLTFARKG